MVAIPKTKVLLSSALVLLSCRTPSLGPLRPSLGAAPPPSGAVSRAETLSDAEEAAELAWILGNARKLAQKRLDEGVAGSPEDVALRLRRGLLYIAELQYQAALDDFLTLVQDEPDSAEGYIALLFIHEYLHTRLGKKDEIKKVLSPLLLDGALSSADRVTLATSILSRIAMASQNVEDVQTHLQRGGWITSFRSVGPLAPFVPSALAEAARYETEGIDAKREAFRGAVPPVRVLGAHRMMLAPVAGDTAGVYVLESHFELGPDADGQPLALELFLPHASKVLIDGVPVVDEGQFRWQRRRRIRVEVELTEGWHRLTISTLATIGSRPSVSLLSTSGETVIARQSATPKASRPNRAPKDASKPRPLDTDAARWVYELSGQKSHSFFSIALGAMIAMTHWEGDLERGREFLIHGLTHAPESAFLLHLNGRLLELARFPTSLAQYQYRKAIKRDPTFPQALVFLARSLSQSSLELALPLIERAKDAAPTSPEPLELYFQVLRKKGWHAEARASLERALKLGKSADLLQSGARFLRSIDHVRDAIALEEELLLMWDAVGPGVLASERVLRHGNIDQAVTELKRSATQSATPTKAYQRASRLELARGQTGTAKALALEALQKDPWSRPALHQLALSQASQGEIKEAVSSLYQIRKIGQSTVRLEALRARLEGAPLAEPKNDTWLGKTLEFDPWPFIANVAGTNTPRGLDPADRWSRHKNVDVLDRVIDHVWPNGQALSLRHFITRLQTKEATDRAGEVNLPADALTLALRTLKPDGRAIDTDRHQGKQDLSFSALAPGDAIEQKWVVIDSPATPWGGYTRKFYFRGSSPIIRSELAVVVPKGAKVWFKSYNNAPEPSIHEETSTTVYYWRVTDMEGQETEPHGVSPEEYLPFVVIAVDLDEQRALNTNLLDTDYFAAPSSDLNTLARGLTAGLKTQRDKINRLFEWVSRETGSGNNRNPSVSVALKRGDQTRLFMALMKSLKLKAELALARPGRAAQVSPPYFEPSRFSWRIIRVRPKNASPIWVTFERGQPWMGKVPPILVGGQYVLSGSRKIYPFLDTDIADWTLHSRIDLRVNEAGTAKGTVQLVVPGTYGGELRKYLKRSSDKDIQRFAQGWVASLFPGAQLEGFEANPQDGLLTPVRLKAKLGIPHFMVREEKHLVAEQFFNAPIASRSLGLPLLSSYLRARDRKTPLMLLKNAERMEANIVLPQGAGAPVEKPKSFRRSATYGRVTQTFSWDPNKLTLHLEREDRTHMQRLSPKSYPAFRHWVQETLQATRNRVIIPVDRVRTAQSMEPPKAEQARKQAPTRPQAPVPSRSRAQGVFAWPAGGP